jgi:hypothetical protein
MDGRGAGRWLCQAPVCRPQCTIRRWNGKFRGSQVRITVGIDLIFRFLRVAAQILSLVFFDDQEGNVVSLGHALGEFLNGFQELLLKRMTSWGGLLLNYLQQSILSEHFFLLVLRVSKSIGINHQNVPQVKMEGAGLVGDKVESSQDQTVGGQFSIFPVTERYK